MKPTTQKIILFWFVKYLVFYIFMMFRNNNYTLIEIDELKSGGALVYYLSIFLYLPIFCTILFSAPICYSFKVKYLAYFLIIIAFTLIAEYLFYTWAASQSDLINGLYNGIISLIFFILFFKRQIIYVILKK